MRFLNEVNELTKKKNGSVYSTKIIGLTLVLALSVMSINAQIGKTVNNKIDLNKIKPNQHPDLTIKQGGKSGFVYSHNGKKKIRGVQVIFDNEILETRQKVYTDENGHFKIALKIGKYKVYAIKNGYIPYVMHPGYSIVNTEFKTLNIFLDKKK